MFTLINGILFYNNVPVHHEGETFKGSFNALIFENNYCYLAPLYLDVNVVINDYIECNNKQNFEVKIQTVTF